MTKEKLTIEDISVSTATSIGGYKIGGDKFKNQEVMRDKRNLYSESDLLQANKEQKPLAIEEQKLENRYQSLSIFFPTYDVHRNLAAAYTLINIETPERVEISAIKDDFVKDLTIRFYESNLFLPRSDSAPAISNRVVELADYSKQLFMEKINQYL